MKKNETHKLPFSDREVLAIFEAARIALSDVDTLASIAESMDVNDKELVDVRDSLEEYLESAC